LFVDKKKFQSVPLFKPWARQMILKFDPGCNLSDELGRKISADAWAKTWTGPKATQLHATTAKSVFFIAVNGCIKFVTEWEARWPELRPGFRRQPLSKRPRSGASAQGKKLKC
jgi:hypothetical protein